MLERSGIVKPFFRLERKYFSLVETPYNLRPTEINRRRRIEPKRENLRALTIAAGFRCTDGVLLCADTEMTLGIAKYPQSKFRHYTTLKSRPAFIYAGDRDFSLMAIGKVARAIHAADQAGEDVELAIQEEIIEIYEKYSVLPVIPGDQPLVLQSLVALFGKRGRQLFSITGPSLAPVSDYACIGVGQYLGYFIGQLTFRSKTFRVNEGALAAAYLLFCAKQCVSGCGGKSQILLLYDNGSWTPFPGDHFDSVPIEQLEADFGALHQVLTSVLIGLGNFGLSTRQYKDNLDRFSTRLSEIRERNAKKLDAMIEAEIERQDRDAAEYLAEHGDEQGEGFEIEG